MKKICILISILSITTIAYSQFNIGIDVVGAFPNGQLKNEVNTGLGGKTYLGYTFKNKIDLSANYGLLYFFSMHDTYNISSATINAKYLFCENLFRPYIGVEIGQYYKREMPDPSVELKDKGIGYAPSVGILLDSKIIKDLFVDLSACYLIMDMKNKYEIFQIEIGLNYRVVSRKDKKFKN